MSNLPNAIIVGAQKCGTTSLFHSLVHHSKVQAPIDPDKNKLIKEIDFFFDDNKWEKGIGWYKDHFRSNCKIFLDSSPNYLINPVNYKRLFQVCPEAKLIICLRNPVDRAYSQYNHYRQDLPDTLYWDWNPYLNFEGNIKLELSRDSDKNSDFSHFLGRGIYIDQIEQLLHYFDFSNIYITILERWRENYKEELSKILDFLNIEIEPLPLLIRHRLPYNFEPMSTEIREILREFYAPYNERLFKFLKFDIPDWLN